MNQDESPAPAKVLLMYSCARLEPIERSSRMVPPNWLVPAVIAIRAAGPPLPGIANV